MIPVSSLLTYIDDTWWWWLLSAHIHWWHLVKVTNLSSHTLMTPGDDDSSLLTYTDDTWWRWLISPHIHWSHLVKMTHLSSHTLMTPGEDDSSLHTYTDDTWWSDSPLLRYTNDAWYCITMPAVLGTYLCHHRKGQGKRSQQISNTSEITTAIWQWKFNLTLIHCSN